MSLDLTDKFTVIFLFVQYFITVSPLFLPSNYEGLVPCDNDNDCNSLKNATCTEGICDCGQPLNVCEEKVYSTTNQIEGTCQDSNFSEYGPGGKCFCKENYVASSDRKTCLKVAEKLGDLCEEDHQCLVNLMNSSSCIGSKCLSLARNIGDYCVESVQCSRILGGGSFCSQGSCQCKDFYHYQSGKCVEDILLNQVCAMHTDCHQPDQETSRLLCVEGVCKCQMGYEEENGYCREVAPSMATRRTHFLWLLLCSSVYHLI